MINQRSTYSPSNRKLNANGSSTVERRPTLYSLFFPSIYYLFILVVIGLGGLLCIIRIYNRPQQKFGIDEGFSKVVKTHISSQLMKEGYVYDSDTLLTNPEKFILNYKSESNHLTFNVQIYSEASKDMVTPIRLLYKLENESANVEHDVVLKSLQDKLNRTK